MVYPSLSTVLAALGGGALIGASASVLLAVNGRIAGISGIVGGLFSRDRHEVLWRGLFVAGLLGGGFLFAVLAPGALVAPSDLVGPDAFGARLSMAVPVIAGLLVGIGTRLSGGCTSGHGVCGVSRLSKRSIAATLTFIAAGMLTVGLTHHGRGP